MADVVAEFILGDEEPAEAVFTVESDIEYKADIEIETAIKEHDRLIHRDYPDQHPMSAITGLEAALQRADTYIHEQGEVSSEWVINHNLNKFPSVTVVDSAGSEIIVGVRYIDSNTCVIDLTSPFKGKAYLN